MCRYTRFASLKLQYCKKEIKVSHRNGYKFGLLSMQDMGTTLSLIVIVINVVGERKKGVQDKLPSWLLLHILKFPLCPNSSDPSQ